MPRLRALPIVLLALVAACGDGATEPPTGSLVVPAIVGLPQGAAPTVTVTGPNGFARTLAAPGVPDTLDALPAGTYTVTAADVTVDGVTWSATPASQAVGVYDGYRVSARAITYTAPGQPAPIDLGLEPVIEGLSKPAFVTAPAGDARLFVVERAGRVLVLKDGALPAPFLDIRARVNSTGERGMLGMAFDPDYGTTGRFYVYYVEPAGSVAVERFESTPGSDVAGASGGVVISIPHGGSEHHGGTIAFGPDGMLYVAPGDGGCCGDPHDNAQNLGVLLGKVLRLDVRGSATYTVPADNPLVGRAGARPEIWAWGLRNPWRFAFDMTAGMLYIGDVGQDAREEIDAVAATAAGLDYGWPVMEGTACYRPSTGCSTAGRTRPVHEYTHADGCSVTGGYVYRGTQIPELAGHYLYADYCRGWLRSFRLTSAGTTTDHHEWPSAATTQALSFGQDGAGELYLVSGTGRVWRIVKK